MKTLVLNSILTGTRALLNAHTLSTLRFARNSENSPVGLHDKDVQSLDLAAALFLECEKEDESNRESLFTQSWVHIKQQCGHTSTKDIHFTQWLDKKSKEWHLWMLDLLIEGRSPVNNRMETAASKASKLTDQEAKRIEIEYV